MCQMAQLPLVALSKHKFFKQHPAIGNVRPASLVAFSLTFASCGSGSASVPDFLCSVPRMDER